MDFVITGTNMELATDRPKCAEVMQRHDPDLRLVWSRAYGIYQGMSILPKFDVILVNGFGWLAIAYYGLVWEFDCPEVLCWGDDHKTMARLCDKWDTRLHPELDDEDWRYQQVEDQRQAAERKVHDDYQHLAQESKRQITRMWEPFMDGNYCR